MKIEINTKHLANILDDLRSVIEKRNTIPALSNVLIESVDGLLRFTATDLDNTLQIDFKAEHEGENLCVSLERLHGLVKALPEQEITIDRLENAFAQIITDSGKYKIGGIKRESFPLIEAAEGQSWECDGTDFLLGISKVFHHTAKDDNHQFGRQEVLFEVNGCLRFVAINGACMTVCEIEPQQPFLKSGEPFSSLTIPRIAARNLIKIFNAEEKVVWWTSDNLITFKQGNKKLTVRKTTREFLDYKLVLKLPEQQVKIKSDELKQTLNVIGSFSTGDPDRYKPADFHFSSHSLSIAADPVDGEEATDEIECESSQEIKARFDVEKIRAALSATLGEPDFFVEPQKMVIASHTERAKSTQFVMGLSK